MEPKDLKYGELYIDDGVVVCYISRTSDRLFRGDLDSFKFIQLDNTEMYYISGWTVKQYIKPL